MRYKLYDVSPKGDKIDTGKVLEMVSTNEAVKTIFKTFGFTNYMDSYRLRPITNDLAFVTYPYQDGVKDTWCVERIVE